MADYCTQACGGLLRASPLVPYLCPGLRSPLWASEAFLPLIHQHRFLGPRVPDQDLCVQRHGTWGQPRPRSHPCPSSSSPVPARLSPTALYSYPPHSCSLYKAAFTVSIEIRVCSYKEETKWPQVFLLLLIPPLCFLMDLEGDSSGAPAQLSASLVPNRRSPNCKGDVPTRVCACLCVPGICM